MTLPNNDRILLISDDESHRKLLGEAVTIKGIDILYTGTPSDALSIIDENYPGIIILFQTSGIPPAVFARRVHAGYPSIDIIGMGFDEDIAGLTFNISPYDGDEMIGLRITKVINDRRALLQCGMSGRSQAIKEVANSILSAAPTELTVLVTGASGSGKELAARAIHQNSKRSEKQFFSINCGALTEGILSSELFGHEKGAFTGAVTLKKGVFESAGDGTIFLDEIGEISSDTQVKLLRVLEDGSFYRVGGTRMLKSKARVVAATNRDLYSEVMKSSFRQDLYYRLRVVEINIPPLSERPEDIPVLTEKFIHDLGSDYRKVISQEVMDIMMRYDWPGNGRELRNIIESRLALSPEGTISRTDVENYIVDTGYQRRNLPVSTNLSPEAAEHQLIIQALMSLKEEISALRNLIVDNLPKTHELGEKPGEIVAEWRPNSQQPFSVKSVFDAEKETIAAALRKFAGNRRKAAEALGIGERTLYRKIAKYNLHSL